MKFHKYSNLENVDTSLLDAGDVVMIRKGSSPYYWEQYKLTSDGELAFVRGVTDEQYNRLEQITQSLINKLSEDYSKQQIDIIVETLEQEIVDAVVQSSATYIPLNSDGSLPTPVTDNNFTILGDGDYGSITADEGNMRIATWDGSTWIVTGKVAMPEANTQEKFIYKKGGDFVFNPITGILSWSGTLFIYNGANNGDGGSYIRITGGQSFDIKTAIGASTENNWVCYVPTTDEFVNGTTNIVTWNRSPANFVFINTNDPNLSLYRDLTSIPIFEYNRTTNNLTSKFLESDLNNAVNYKADLPSTQTQIKLHHASKGEIKYNEQSKILSWTDSLFIFNNIKISGAAPFIRINASSFDVGSATSALTGDYITVYLNANTNFIKGLNSTTYTLTPSDFIVKSYIDDGVDEIRSDNAIILFHYNRIKNEISSPFGFIGSTEEPQVDESPRYLEFFNKGLNGYPAIENSFGFICAGQSNEEGRIDPSQLPSWYVANGNKITDVIINNSNTLNWHEYNDTDGGSGGQFSYEVMLLKMISDNLKSTDVNAKMYGVKRALGGTSIAIQDGEGSGRWSAEFQRITDFNPSLTHLLRQLEQRIRQAVASPNGSLFQFRAVFWHQGEADRNAPNDYFFNLKNLIYYIRGVVNNPYLPFFLAGINNKSTSYNAIVEQAKIDLANEDRYIYHIPSDNLQTSLKSDSLHLNYQGGLDLATKIYNKMLEDKTIFGLN